MHKTLFSALIRSRPVANRNAFKITTRTYVGAVERRHHPPGPLKVVRTISETRDLISDYKHHKKIVGFVPTMGALHQGHMHLVKQAKEECDKVVVSIFVNPTQFGPNEDFNRYPRQEDKDMELLQQHGVDALFLPSVDVMYPKESGMTFVEVQGMDQTIEGKARPGHFRGVATVVTKLFNIVQPHRAYFGAKDAVQCILVQRLARELNIPVEVVIGETVREPDGLAMSSRNMYLSPEDRKAASVLYRSLKAAADMYKQKKREEGDEVVITTQQLAAVVRDVLSSEPRVTRIEYVSIADPFTAEELKPETEVKPGHMISIAAFLGKTRLIDNITLS